MICRNRSFLAEEWSKAKGQSPVSDSQWRRHSTSRKRTFALRALRRRTERGAAMVETALVFFPLCLILFGIVEYGFIFKDSLTLSSATRQGVRTGSAMGDQADSTFYAATVAAVQTAATAASFKANDELWIYEADSSGNPAGGTCGSNCQLYRWNATSKTFNYVSGSWPAANRSACSGSTLDSMGVRLSLSHDAVTGFFRNLQLKEKTIMRFEPINC